MHFWQTGAIITPKGKKNILISILQLIFLAVFIYSSVQIIKWYRDNKEANSLKEELIESNLNDNLNLCVGRYTLKDIKEEYINGQLRKTTGEYYHYLNIIRRLQQATPIQAHTGFYPNI